MTKVCPKCKQTKSTTEFNKSKANNDGLTHKCKQCVYEYNNKWTKDNKEHVAKKLKEWNKNNPNYAKEWVENNKDHLNSYNRIYRAKVRKENPTKRIMETFRNQVAKNVKIKGFLKGKSTLEILGLESWDEFRKHIESQFIEGMSWDNYGNKVETDWSIDHIIPVSSAITLEEFYKLNHYSNLRPLWHIDNLRKGNRF
jgi:hypothetical protein